MLLARQIGDAVDKAMSRLQPELAEALVLYEVEGKSYKEIAEMLGTPIGTVRTRIFRAREFIARRLEPVLRFVGVTSRNRNLAIPGRDLRPLPSPTVHEGVDRCPLRCHAIPRPQERETYMHRFSDLA